MARFKYSAMRRYRGGYVPGGRTFSSMPVRTGRTSMGNRPLSSRLVGAGVNAGNMYLNRKFPKAYKAFSSYAGMSPLDFAVMLYEKHKGNSGSSIPGMGVITSPSSRSAYFSIKNKGSGMTSSKYTTGKATSLPKSVDKNAYRVHYVLSNPAENFNIQNPTSIQNGVAQYLTLTDTIMNTVSSLIPGGTLGTSDLASMYMSSIKSVITITSATNLNCKLRIYECVSKKDTNISKYRTPIDAWANGIDATTGGASATTYQSIGLYPSNSAFFRDYWHVDSYYDIELAAGASHQHKSTYNINTTIPFSWFKNHGGSAVTSGLTRAYLFVLSSSPVHDSSDEGLVRLGVSSVDINIVQTFEAYGIPNTDETLSLAIAGDNVVSERVITQSDIIESVVQN